MEAQDGGIPKLVGGPVGVTAAIDHMALLNAAWAARSNARVLGKTPVGAAALASSGHLSTGCNVEHKFRSHDIHAEVNAISSLVAAGDSHLIAIAIVSTRDRFTPCGACLDWIFEIGGPKCLVLISNRPGEIAFSHLAEELMPFYPF